MKKKMKKVMFLFAIVALTILAQSCEPGPNLEAKSYVSGVVTDAATGNPIVVLILVFFSIFVSCYKRKS